MSDAEALFWDCAAEIALGRGGPRKDDLGCGAYGSRVSSWPCQRTIGSGEALESGVNDLIDAGVGEVCAPTGRPFREWAGNSRTRRSPVARPLRGPRSTSSVRRTNPRLAETEASAANRSDTGVRQSERRSEAALPSVWASEGGTTELSHTAYGDSIAARRHRCSSVVEGMPDEPSPASRPVANRPLRGCRRTS